MEDVPESKNKVEEKLAAIQKFKHSPEVIRQMIDDLDFYLSLRIAKTQLPFNVKVFFNAIHKQYSTFTPAEIRQLITQLQSYVK
ncbi:hypothetical protein A3A95_01135 [Candidatus Nomurabacteria bacterium RIFCSPLOWO2_01_FULL_39_18]|uniref:Uncharacterized protein n=1 Tax=Candidatus Nomurabacteria bacterium RIFCSPHIGHO2_01_FULL_40_24b TaxID=1801739 RepID=A0A1F6V723_9BACT|nr:MAG: hypothetical protein A2647_02935 [Candidatus Nomurabacteria bacterium RIFCSPHIGHO2_01_FULL_40_24b]OGI89910.1 MAG: hypothetical protein A3A95_01135 [Candidatus Nomurabacteria bacterium RIFCSPLOWO2_01_FULL_39_18]